MITTLIFISSSLFMCSSECQTTFAGIQAEHISSSSQRGSIYLCQADNELQKSSISNYVLQTPRLLSFAKYYVYRMEIINVKCVSDKNLLYLDFHATVQFIEFFYIFTEMLGKWMLHMFTELSESKYIWNSSICEWKLFSGHGRIL